MLRKTIYFILFLMLPCSLLAKSKKKGAVAPLSVTSIVSSIREVSPALWPQGMRFVCLEGCAGGLLHPEDTTLADSTYFIPGAQWIFDAMVSEEDWMGRQLLQLRFLSADGQPFRFDTGKTMDAMTDTTYHPVMDGLYPLEIVQKADSFLRARVLYININDERVSYDESCLSDSSFVPMKYVPVSITGVEFGNVAGPLKVRFAGEKLSGSFYASLPDSRESLTSSPLQRFLSTENPRLNYPDITDETWALLQRSEYAIGMTMEEVRLSIGRPLRFERVTTRAGIVERWLYPHSRVLEFLSGRLAQVGRSLTD